MAHNKILIFLLILNFDVLQNNKEVKKIIGK